MRPWIFSCKKVTGMVSQSMDTRLSLYKRIGIQFHLMMCVLCRRYKQQLLFIRSFIRQNNEGLDDPKQTLPSDARKRIEKKLTDEAKRHSIDS